MTKGDDNILKKYYEGNWKMGTLGLKKPHMNYFIEEGKLVHPPNKFNCNCIL